MVKAALCDDAWVSKIKLSTRFFWEHLTQFVTPWTTIHGFQLDEHAQDEIVWKHTDDWQYSATSAYKAQFLGTFYSPTERSIWKAPPPHKVKFFAWLATQDRL